MPLKYTPTPEGIRIAEAALHRHIEHAKVQAILLAERQRLHERMESVVEWSEGTLFDTNAPDDKRQQAAERVMFNREMQAELPDMEARLSEGMENVLGAMDGLSLKDINAELLLEMLPEEEKQNGVSALRKLISIFAWEALDELGLDRYTNAGDIVEAMNIIQDRLQFKPY